MSWRTWETFDAPPKPATASPKAYLSQLDRWSAKKVAEVRKQRAKDGYPHRLRRFWHGFTLIIEYNLAEDEPIGAPPSVGYRPKNI